MEWRKGFLTEAPPPNKLTQRKKANALPDDAFLPAETYDLADDDGECWLHSGHHFFAS